MAIFDFKRAELSDDQLANVNGGVIVNLEKAGMGSTTLNVTRALIDSLEKAGQLGTLIATFQYLGQFYVEEINDLRDEYEGSGYSMPTELEEVLMPYYL